MVPPELTVTVTPELMVSVTPGFTVQVSPAPIVAEELITVLVVNVIDAASASGLEPSKTENDTANSTSNSTLFNQIICHKKVILIMNLPV